MSELSHFEELSAKTPKTQPYAILIGAALLPLIIWVISLVAPTESVKELKGAGKEKDTPVMTQAMDDGEEI